MSSAVRKQRLRQLSETLGAVHFPRRPKIGWLKEIRQLLGISERVLGRVLKVDQSTIARLEKSEACDTISLNRLKDLANALHCDLQYALVPRKPLQQIIHDQAMKAARKTLLAVDRSMALEDQRTDKDELEQQIHDLAQELIAKGDKRIWDDL